MRTIINLFLVVTGLAMILQACDKKDTLPVYGEGVTTTLSTSSTTLTPAPADSNNVALTLSWTSPKYSTDTANYKYVIEMDSTTKNFANPIRKTVMGKLNTTYLAKELNSMLLARGYAFNVPVDMDVRLISSYGNNNEKKISNVIKIKMTPYKIPPKVPLPATSRLFIVGSATVGQWTNPVPVPTQEFSRLDETTWAGVFQITGGGSYLLLPENGQWTKYGFVGANNQNPVTGGDFKAEGGDLLAPAASGLYKITVDFQFGKFKVEPYTGTLPASLFIVGNATPGGDASGWNNPVPVPAQQFTRVNSSLFELTIALNPDKSYLFLPVNGSWAEKFGGLGANNSNNVNGDDIKYNGSDMKSPAVAGTYKISVNFAASNAAGASARTTLVKQ
jgi:starch-binding outer membrane protein SusE/F